MLRSGRQRQTVAALRATGDRPADPGTAQPQRLQSQVAGARIHQAGSAEPRAARGGYELDEGRSDGQLRISGKLFRAAMNGSQRALGVCAVNLCGMSLNKPEVQVVTNVIQNAQPQRSEAEVGILFGDFC